MRVQTACPFNHDLGRQGLHRQSVRRDQTGAGAGLELLVGQAVRQQGGEGLAGGVQLGKGVAPGLDEGADPFGGRILGHGTPVKFGQDAVELDPLGVV